MWGSAKGTRSHLVDSFCSFYLAKQENTLKFSFFYCLSWPLDLKAADKSRSFPFMSIVSIQVPNICVSSSRVHPSARKTCCTMTRSICWGRLEYLQTKTKNKKKKKKLLCEEDIKKPDAEHERCINLSEPHFLLKPQPVMFPVLSGPGRTEEEQGFKYLSNTISSFCSLRFHLTTAAVKRKNLMSNFTQFLRTSPSVHNQSDSGNEINKLKEVKKLSL